MKMWTISNKIFYWHFSVLFLLLFFEKSFPNAVVYASRLYYLFFIILCSAYLFNIKVRNTSNKTYSILARTYVYIVMFYVVRCVFFDDNSHTVGNHFFVFFSNTSTGVICFLLPLFSNLTAKGMFVEYINRNKKKVVAICGAVYIYMFLSGKFDSFYYSSLVVCFILPYYIYKSWTKVLVFIIIVLVCIYYSYYSGERSVFIYVTISLLSFVAVKLKFPLWSFKIYSIILVVFVVMMYVYILIYDNSIFERLSMAYSANSDFQDTRTFLFTEVKADLLSNNCLLFGKGILGTYYSPYFDMNVSGDGDYKYRIGTEAGLLNCLLKGGLFYLLFYSSLLLLAVKNVFTKANNDFVKVIGLLIINYFFVSSISMVNNFNLVNIVIWIFVGFCYNRNLVEKTDKQFIALLK